MQFQQQYPELTDGLVSPGQTVPIEVFIPRMRLAQLLDLARAYEIKVNFNGTKQKVLPIIQAEADAGTFQRPAKHPYYRERAFYSSDDVKKAKSQLSDESGTPPDPRTIPAQIRPWYGPLNEPQPAVKTVSRETKPEPEEPSERDLVHARCKELGIAVKGKTVRGLKMAITFKERQLAKSAESAESAAPETEAAA